MLSDEKIISLYKEGNEIIFRDLINRYTSPIHNFALRFVDKNTAKDIVQETFIKTWKNLKKFDNSKSSFKTWIFIIAKNTITDFLRKKKDIKFSDMEKENDEDGDPFFENIPDENILPDEALQRIQDEELLNKALENIPLNYKNILILHYQEEMTFEEIGQILSKPLNTVKSQHRRAIIELRKIIK